MCGSALLVYEVLGLGRKRHILAAMIMVESASFAVEPSLSAAMINFAVA
jgi:hypothetical protein